MDKRRTGILVIKLGTRLLTASNTNKLDEFRIKNLASQMSALVKRGYKTVIVSSGAIGAGMGILGLASRPHSLPKLQACAAIGQGELMKIYSDIFKKENLTVAQILLTQDDFDSRERYLNVKNTLLELLDSSVIPIINENDTVSTDEIKFGDNDRLSSLVASLLGADKLIILTDVDNLYRYDLGGRKEPIFTVNKITKDIEALAKDTSSHLSRGGMITKLQAAKTVTETGIACHLVNGNTENILLKIVDGNVIGTLFEPCESCIKAKKRWIVSVSKKKGSVVVDKGAEDALINKNKSLLSSGIIGVKGHFNIGDSVGVSDCDGNEFARGLVNYNSKDIDKIKGLQTSHIEKALGYKYYDEIIHKDNLVIL